MHVLSAGWPEHGLRCLYLSATAQDLSSRNWLRRALAILAHLHGFMGEQVNCHYFSINARTSFAVDNWLAGLSPIG